MEKHSLQRHLPTLILGLLALSSLLWLIKPWRWLVDDETAIRRSIARVVEAVNTHRIRGVTAEFAENYTDPFHENRDELAHSVRRFTVMFRERELRAAVENVEIEVDPGDESATVTLTPRGAAPVEQALRRFDSERLRLRYERTAWGWKIAETEKASP